MPSPGLVVGLAAVVVAAGYLLAALVAETPRTGSPLPAPPLPETLRRRLTGPRRHAAAGVVAVTVLVGAGVVWEPVGVPAVLLLGLGVPAAYTDARELRLPDELTYTLAATTIGAVVGLQLTGSGDGAVRAVLSGAGYGLALLLFALIAPTATTVSAEAGSVRTAAPSALGLGDIKLAVGLGVGMGWTSVTAVTGAVFLTAAGHLLWLIACSTAHRLGYSRGMSATALGPWMVFGAAAALAVSIP